MLGCFCILSLLEALWSWPIYTSFWISHFLKISSWKSSTRVKAHEYLWTPLAYDVKSDTWFSSLGQTLGSTVKTRSILCKTCICLIAVKTFLNVRHFYVREVRFSVALCCHLSPSQPRRGEATGESFAFLLDRGGSVVLLWVAGQWAGTEHWAGAQGGPAFPWPSFPGSVSVLGGGALGCSPGLSVAEPWLSSSFWNFPDCSGRKQDLCGASSPIWGKTSH